MASAKRKDEPLFALILAAGQGKRMRSGRIKMLHALGGAPMVGHVVKAAAALSPQRLAAVVGNQAEAVTGAIEAAADGAGAGVRFARQERQLGTGHAVLMSEPLWKGAGKATLMILNGDVPLIRPETLRRMLEHHRRAGAAVTVLTTRVARPAGYGRVVRDTSGSFQAIVEDRDATPAQKRLDEINAGLYCADLEALFSALRKTGRDNAQGEQYLPDVVPILLRQGLKAEAFLHDDAEEVLGVNDRAELARAGKTLYRRRAEELMASGVTIVDPSITYIEPGVTVGPDTVIHPLARLEGRTAVGAGCVIGALCRLTDTTVGDGAVLLDLCVASESVIGPGAKVGPLAHLRPGTVLDEGVHIGNFVEVKKSRLGKGSKANHLSYLGDAVIGRGCNIGAGTITCNYDGVAKHQTILEDEVFIGSDTQLVAPVRVRRGAYVGAGSTITKEVPEYALALTRAELRVIKDWVRRKQEERKAASAAKAAPPAAAAGRRSRRKS
ncbi:MAG TPA: bifunctional UDP-N-acetylglucosamine diphosphorylase/glucosamine-1-phosphate N-acetyltransferase GlmU [Candidatus Polarisedimenticolia bacterium]|nr:bifunctional UDP-N-acetylglucosamine diphosphorylase/glucosamine-1-phosphate N-acetyltransferase GlmU [Candidatus Polarisedimenticolia bacterium]